MSWHRCGAVLKSGLVALLFVRAQIGLIYEAVWPYILTFPTDQLVQCWLELVSGSKLNLIAMG